MFEPSLPCTVERLTIAIVNKVEHVERACETAAVAKHAQEVTGKGLK